MSLNDFELGKLLGKGAFGSVLIVKRIEDGQIYAMKRVKIVQLSSKERENAFNEVRILASLSHSNIIGYKEAFFDDPSQTLNIIMEFADDGDLASKIKQNAQYRLSFHETTIWQWLIQIIQGLQYLHDNKIMHRDLKSANIFLKKNGTIKLGDLNVSKIAKLGMAYTQTGTPYYASPEIWKDQPYDYKCDVWSVGCIIYELCTLKPPFRGTSLHQLNDNVNRGIYEPIPRIYSPELGKVIEKMLTVDPNRRPTCSQLLSMDIIVRKGKEIRIESVASDKGMVNLMKTIKLPRDIRDINKELPKKRYNKKREEMMECDEYETRKNFYQPNEKEDNVNVIIYYGRENEEKKNRVQSGGSKERVNLDEVNQKYFHELREKEKERERARDKERERIKEIERAKEIEREKEREKLKQEQEQLKQRELHNKYNQNLLNYNEIKEVSSSNEPTSLKPPQRNPLEQHQDKSKKQQLLNDYKHDSEVIKNNRNYINEYLEREKNLKLQDRNLNNLNSAQRDQNSLNPSQNQSDKKQPNYLSEKDKEIEQIKDKYKLLIVKPTQEPYRNALNELEKLRKENNLANYKPNYLNMNNIQLAQDIKPKPKGNNNLANQRPPSAHNANYQNNKQFIYNYKEYLPSNQPKSSKEVNNYNNIVQPSNNKYEPRALGLNYNLNKQPSKERLYEPMSNNNHYQPINMDAYLNKNREHLGKNRKAVIEKLDYKSYLMNKEKANAKIDAINMHYQPQRHANNNLIGNNNKQQSREYMARAFALDQKIIRNGPKLLHIKR